MRFFRGSHKAESAGGYGVTKVLICPVDYEHRCEEGAAMLRAHGYDLRFNPRQRGYLPNELYPDIADVEAVVADNEPWDEASFRAAPKLRVIAKIGVGMNNFDLEAARRHKVVVANCAGINANTVAEHTVALLLAIVRALPQLNAGCRRGKWTRGIFHELTGKTAGIVGFGAIGRKVAEKLAAFELRLIATDINPNHKEANRIGVQLVESDTLWRESDYVLLHAPYLMETHHLINDTTLSKMKDGAYLINTARGPLVNEAAAARALASGKLAGMASDVFEVEPPPANNPLFACENYICTPHSAGDAVENMQANGRATAAIILDYFAGLEPKNRQA